MPWYLIRRLSAAVLGGLALVALCGSSALAATTPKTHEAVYRCRDANGQSHFGQSIPAVCIGRDIDVLDNTGRVVRRIDSTAALSARAGQQDQADAEKRAAETAAQRDRTLLATYLSVADIERLRDNRLEILVQQSAVTRISREPGLVSGSERSHWVDGGSSSPDLRATFQLNSRFLSTHAGYMWAVASAIGRAKA